MAYTREKKRERQTRQKALILTILLQIMLVAGLFFHSEIADWMQQFLGFVQPSDVSLP